MLAPFKKGASMNGSLGHNSWLGHNLKKGQVFFWLGHSLKPDSLKPDNLKTINSTYGFGYDKVISKTRHQAFLQAFLASISL